MKIINWIDKNIKNKFSAFVLFSMFAFVLLMFAQVLNLAISLNTYDYVTIGTEKTVTEETVMLEVAEKSRQRAPNVSGKITAFLYPYKYMLTFKSDDEAYNGKSLSVNKEIFKKYEIGKSYEFRIKTTTTQDKKIIPL